MTTEMKSFAALCKGDELDLIEKALWMLKPPKRSELMEHFKAHSVRELAEKIRLGR